MIAWPWTLVNIMSMSTSNSLRVGVIGLGNMGRPMATQLIRSEQFEKIFLYNRSKEKATELTRSSSAAHVADSVKELMQETDVVMTSLSNADVTEKLYFDVDDGIISAVKPGQVVVDHGTNPADLIARIFQEIAAKGAFFLDAPVSGGPPKAEIGQLAIYVGGDEEGFQKARPVLDVIGGCVKRMGKSGTGITTKLVNQLLVGVHSVASMEAMILAEKLGVTDVEALAEVLSNSLGNSEVLQRNIPMIANGAPGNPSGAPLRTLLKDIRLVDDTLHGMPSIGVARRLYEEALEQGYEEADITSPYLLIKKDLGL